MRPTSSFIRRACSFLLVGAAVVLCSLGRAEANPFYLARFGGLRSDVMMTGAYSLYWNPAALGRPGWDAAFDTTVIARQASFDRDAVLNNISVEKRALNSGYAPNNTATPVPSIMARYGFTSHGFDIGLGAGLFVDIAGSANWPKNKNAPAQFPGAYDGVQRFASIATSLTVISASVGFGLRHRASGLSIGIAPILDFVSFSTVRAINLDGTDDLVDNQGRLKEGRAYFKGKEVNGRFILGARWDYHTKTGWDRYSVAFSYQHGPSYDVKGTLQLALATAPVSSANAHVVLPIADVLRLGASIGVHRRLVLRPSIEWALWRILHQQVFETQVDHTALVTFPRNFVDSIAGRLRADVLLHDRVELQLSAGFERGATPSSTMDPGLGENHSAEGGVGVLAALNHRVDLSLGCIVQYFLPTTVSDSIQKPTTNGRYTDTREFVSLFLEVHGWRPYPGSLR